MLVVVDVEVLKKENEMKNKYTKHLTIYAEYEGYDCDACGYAEYFNWYVPEIGLKFYDDNHLGGTNLPDEVLSMCINNDYGLLLYFFQKGFIPVLDEGEKPDIEYIYYTDSMNIDDFL